MNALPTIQRASARWMLLLFMGGCATVTHTYPQPLSRAVEQDKWDARLLDDGYADYTGVIHIHTRYSHDAQGRMEDVVRVANAQRLDYVIVTEHNNLRPLREGWQGMHGKTLMLVGMEVSTRSGHYLSFGVTQEIDKSVLTTQQVIDEVNRQGGLGFIAHPYFRNCRWRNWSVHGFTGIEIYNAAHDTLDENRARLVLWTLTTPAEPFYLSILDRPYDPLAKWDELIHRYGRCVGIGSVDAHEFHVMGVRFAAYEDLFQIARTHVLITPQPLTAPAIYDAYRQGHVYVGIGIVGDTQGFAFMADDGRKVLGIMGDEVPLAPNMELTVVLPAPANLTLFKDGQVIDAKTGSRWHIPIAHAGVYRIEAMRHGKPWVFSNPIYVRPAPTVVDSPSS